MDVLKIIYLSIGGVCIVGVLIIFIMMVRQLCKHMRETELYFQELKRKRELEKQEQMRLQEEQKKIVQTMYPREGD